MDQAGAAPPGEPTESLAAKVMFRAVRPADAEELATMQALPGFRFGTLRPPFPSPERIRKHIEQLSERTTMIVAVRDGAIVASGDLSAYAGRRAHVGSIGLGVHDDYVGQGIGGALLRELLGVADRWAGLRRVELTVYADNARAIALYRRCGFAVEGTHRAYAFRDGRFVDALAMARLIEPGSG